MRMHLIFLILIGISLPAVAADLNFNAVSRQCVSYQDSQLPIQSETQIEFEIYRNFEASRAAMDTTAVVVSRSAAFTWANEARISCGIAIGYFESDIIDAESIGKCDCFYNRYLTLR